MDSKLETLFKITGKQEEWFNLIEKRLDIQMKINESLQRQIDLRGEQLKTLLNLVDKIARV